jgi:D-alanine-D-alanine ligase
MTAKSRAGTEAHVAVLMGGPSAEREVSLKSGAAVLKALQKEGVRATAVDVRGADFELPPDTDVAFLALHGTFGEDGTVQRLLEKAGVAYTGSGAQASALAFDKIAAKDRFLKKFVPTPDGFVITDANARTPLFNFPVVVKPARQGSTIGVTLVRRDEDFRAACELALKYDTHVLVESFVQGRELTVGILEDKPLPVVEIVTEAGFFDYRAKYTKGATQYIVPARLTECETLLVQDIGVRAFRALGCGDYGRVDIILGADCNPYVLEVNTLPGMTETSLLPMAAAQEGLAFGELCVRMVELALNRRLSKRARAAVQVQSRGAEIQKGVTASA